MIVKLIKGGSVTTLKIEGDTVIINYGKYERQFKFFNSRCAFSFVDGIQYQLGKRKLDEVPLSELELLAETFEGTLI